ncbi:MAG: calcium-binding protein [Agitococcus sp.]|nr:calcium-binding protein [Agitococcus sp.]
MNQEIKTAFEYALLARAAYANLNKDSNIVNVLTDADPSLNSKNGWPPALAIYFDRRYKVLDSELNGENDYQGIIFQEKDAQGNLTQNYILANRGTETGSLNSLWNDLLVTDLGQLALLGIADQVRAMHEFVRRIVTEHQITALNATGHSLGGYLSSMAMIEGDNKALFKELYTYNGAGVESVFYINNFINLYNQLAGHPLTMALPTLNANNYITSEGLEIISGTGDRIGKEPVYINVDNISVLGHGLAPIADTLTVYYLLGMVDNDISINDLNAIKEASSSQGFTTNADVMNDNDALVKAFGTLLSKALDYSSDTKDAVAEVGSDNAKMHKAIFTLVDELNNAPQALNIAPLVTFDGNGNFQLLTNNQSTDNIAYRYALTELNSFVVEGLTYTDFNQNQELDLYNETTGEGGITAQWLETRSQMLAAYLKANTRNQLSTTHTGRGNFIYQDLADSNHPINLTDNSTTSTPVNDPDSPLTEDTHLIKFAGNTAQTLNGGASDDYLFGGTGTDTLNGKEGNDYLEGGLGNDALDGEVDNDTLYGMAGEDSLVGGAGNDTLKGGKGNDTLTGGLDKDILEGGAEDDTYIFTTGDGHDTVIDSQGNNLLTLNGASNITATSLDADSNVYQDNHKNRYLKTEDSLWIFATQQGDIIQIKNWSTNNNFGITLDNSSTVSPSGETTSTDIDINRALAQTLTDQLNAPYQPYEAGDPQWTVEDISRYLSSYLSRQTREEVIAYNNARIHYDGSLPQAPTTVIFNHTTFEGGDLNDELVGSNDRQETLNGMGGNDFISAGNGDNIVYGGTGSDIVIGGAQSDVLYGSGIGYQHINLTAASLSAVQASSVYRELKAQHALIITPLSNGNYTLYQVQYQADQISDINLLSSGAGEDSISAGEGNDLADGGTDNDTVLGDTGSDILNGSAGNDELWGDSHLENVLWTLGGQRTWQNHVFMIHQSEMPTNESVSYNDTISGGAGDDTLMGEVGADTLTGDTGDDFIVGDRFNSEAYYQDNHVFLEKIGAEPFSIIDADTDTLSIFTASEQQSRRDSTLNGWVNLELSLHGNDLLSGGAGNDKLLGNGGDDILQGDEGDDWLWGDDPTEIQNATDPNNPINIAIDTQTIGNDTLWGGAGNDQLMGGEGNDVLDGGNDNDTLIGGEGNDTLLGGSGHDILYAKDPSTTSTTSDSDTLYGGMGNDTLYGGLGGDLLSGDEGDDRLDGKAGNDTLMGGLGKDQLQGAKGNDQLLGGAEADTLMGGEGNDQLDGEDGNDMLYGETGNDVLKGGSGADRLYGQQGNDTLEGGAGNDQLYADVGDDIYICSIGDGRDVIIAATANPMGFGELETATANLDTDRVMFTYSPNAVTRVSRSSTDLVIDYGTNDQIRIKDYYHAYGTASQHFAIASFQFADGSEWTSADILSMASPPAISEPLPNVAYFIDALVSREDIKVAGQTTMTYSFASAATIETGFTLFTLEQLAAIEQALATFAASLNIQFVKSTTGTSDLSFFLDDLASGDLGVAAGYANASTGEIHLSSEMFSTTDALNTGQYGFEVLLHEIGHALGLKHPFEAPVLPEAENTQNNTVMSYSSNQHNDTGLKLFDIAALQYFYGVNNALNTGDSQHGFTEKYIADATGNDVFDASEQVTHVTVNLNQGGWSFIGEKQSSILAEGQTFIGYGTDIENAMTGTGNDTLIGNHLNNRLTSGEGNDTLTGGLGSDELNGGAGADTYTFTVGDGVDHLIETGNDNTIVFNSIALNTIGYDNGFLYYGINGDKIQLDTNTVSTWIVNDQSYSTQDFQVVYGGGQVSDNSITLDEQSNSGLLTGSANVDVTGNQQANSLRGNSGHNVLDGGLGADTLMGSLGDDTYIIDNKDDMVIEKLNEGQDHIITRVDYTLSENVERLTLAANAKMAKGNALDNVLTANDLGNKLSGYSGNDSLWGGLGNDTLEGQNGQDILWGGSGNDLLYGGSDNDTLFGGQGNDTLIGGDGVDSYVFYRGDGQDLIGSGYSSSDVANDILQLQVSADALSFQKSGVDLFIRIVDSSDSIRLPYYFSNDGATMATINDIRSSDGQVFRYADVRQRVLQGTPFDDVISGFDVPNSIQGQAGNDTLVGSSFNDTIEGGVGNDVVTGQDGNDFLDGGTGDDILNGGLGADILQGGAGDDHYLVNYLSDLTEDALVEQVNAGQDTIKIAHIYAINNAINVDLRTWQNIEGVDLGKDIRSYQAASVAIIGNDSNNTFYRVNNSNVTYTGGMGDDTYEVVRILTPADASAPLPQQQTIELANQGTDTVIVYDPIGSGIFKYDSYVLADHIENMILRYEKVYSEALRFDGNSLNNIITGSQMMDTIWGKDGHDTLYGGASDDVLFAGTGNDQLYGGADNDRLYGNEGDDLLDGGDGIDQLHGNEGNDTLSGGLGNDTLYGEEGNNQLQGGAGDDLLFGDVGDDNLDGGDGQDQLDGSLGMNTLTGGAGNDTLTANGSVDVFIGGLDNDVLSVGSEKAACYFTSGLDVDFDVVQLNNATGSIELNFATELNNLSLGVYGQSYIIYYANNKSVELQGITDSQSIRIVTQDSSLTLDGFLSWLQVNADHYHSSVQLISPDMSSAYYQVS